jgi:hypothetical protein
VRMQVHAIPTPASRKRRRVPYRPATRRTTVPTRVTRTFPAEGRRAPPNDDTAGLDRVISSGAVTQVDHDARAENGDVHKRVPSAFGHVSRQISRSETGPRIAARTYATAPSITGTIRRPCAQPARSGPRRDASRAAAVCDGGPGRRTSGIKAGGCPADRESSYARAAHARRLHAACGRARESWLRELMSSLANTLRRW